MGSAFSAGSSPTGIGIRLTEVSASEANDPRALLYVIDRMAPGSSMSRVVEVSNNSLSSQVVVCYDSAANIVGGAFVGAEGDSSNELTSWMSISKQNLIMKRGAKAKVRVTFDVPSDASPGERYGAIWAEIRSKNTSSGIVTINRVGIRVYLSVGEGGAPASSFDIKSISVKRNIDASPELDAIVSNTGGRALDISGELKLSGGPAGLSAGPFTTNLGTTLAIGESEVVHVLLPKDVPDGPWDAELTLRSGLVSKTVSARITFPPAGEVRPVVIQSISPWAVVAFALAGALALSISTIAYRASRRRLHARRRRAKKH